MNMGEKFTAFVLLLIILIMCSLCLGYHFGVTATQQEAVKKGNAQYIADPDGKPKFEWRKNDH